MRAGMGESKVASQQHSASLSSQAKGRELLRLGSAGEPFLGCMSWSAPPSWLSSFLTLASDAGVGRLWRW